MSHYITSHEQQPFGGKEKVLSEVQYFHKILYAELDDCFDLPDLDQSAVSSPGHDIPSTDSISSLFTVIGTKTDRITDVWAMAEEVPSTDDTLTCMVNHSNPVQAQLKFLMNSCDWKSTGGFKYMTNKSILWIPFRTSNMRTKFQINSTYFRRL